MNCTLSSYRWQWVRVNLDTTHHEYVQHQVARPSTG